MLMFGLWLGGASPAVNRIYARLVDDGFGGWAYAMSASGYGLSDDGEGGWEWADSPDYRLNAASSTSQFWE